MKTTIARALALAALFATPIHAQQTATQAELPSRDNTAPVITRDATTGPQELSAPALVTAADIRAADAGREMLDAGGSAADAAIATMLALTVVEPQSSGIGGGGFFVYYDADTQQTVTVDGREEAPAAARGNRFLNADGTPMPYDQAQPGGISVGVPGNIRLAAEVHGRYGRLPWARLFEPAIRLASDGFAVSRWLETALRSTDGRWADFPQARALYYINGQPARQGQTIRNPELASVLREVAANGPDSFYRGATARAIVQAVRTTTRHPGDMTERDLAAYRAIPRDAVCTTYRVYRLCGMGPPSSGATTVFAIMGMLETFDMQRMGVNNPMSWHVMREAMHLAYADRDTYVGDPNFVDVPVQGMIDRNYLHARAQLISPFAVQPSYAPGTPPGAQPRTHGPSGEVPSTSQFIAVDRSGSVATMTSTVEGIFGSQLVARGIILNNELTDFTATPELNGAPVANRVEPGKRPRSSMAPTIVYNAAGEPILAVGSAGGARIIMYVVKTLVGVLDFGMSADDALALPNLFMAGDNDVIENTQLGTQLAPELTRFGRNVVTAEISSKLNAAQRNADGSGWTGSADPRSVGGVAAVQTDTRPRPASNRPAQNRPAATPAPAPASQPAAREPATAQ